MQKPGQDSRRFLSGSLGHARWSAVGVRKMLIEIAEDTGQDSPIVWCGHCFEHDEIKSNLVPLGCSGVRLETFWRVPGGSLKSAWGLGTSWEAVQKLTSKKGAMWVSSGLLFDPD